jgi:hypothetical protein
MAACPVVNIWGLSLKIEGEPLDVVGVTHGP